MQYAGSREVHVQTVPQIAHELTEEPPRNGIKDILVRHRFWYVMDENTFDFDIGDCELIASYQNIAIKRLKLEHYGSYHL